MTVFLQGVYLPTLSVYDIGINEDTGKRLPQLHCIKMKICYDSCFIDIRVTMATQWHRFVFYLPLCFSVLRVFFSRNRLRVLVPPLVSSVMAKKSSWATLNGLKLMNWFFFWDIICRNFLGVGLGGLFPSYRPIGMCCWMESCFLD